MKNTILILTLAYFSLAWTFEGGWDPGQIPADRIKTDVTNFDGNLSATDIDVQTALETLDDSTETDPNSLWLDQTTPQTISNGVPIMQVDVADITDSHSLVTREYVDQAVTAINVNYYLLDTASGVSDYKDLQIDVPSEVEATVSKAISVTDTYIQGWISPATGTPTTLIAGIYNLYVEAYVNATAGTKRINLYWTLVERKADTSEVTIATSEDGEELTMTHTDQQIHIALPTDYAVTAGSRIVGKVYAQLSGSGSNPTVTLAYLGSVNSHWAVPSNTEVLTNVFVPYSGAVGSVNLGSNTLITSGNIGIGTTEATDKLRVDGNIYVGNGSIQINEIDLLIWSTMQR